MPLTQFSTLVLPAPLGPISAKSSPRSTANDTSSSTVKPPKRRLRPATASSAIPAPAAPVLLDRAVAPMRTAGEPEIELLDVGMAGQPRGIAVEHDAAAFHHVGVIGDLQRHRGVLLDQQHGDIELAADLDQPADQGLDPHGG